MDAGNENDSKDNQMDHDILSVTLIEDYTCCDLCGGELRFEHRIDYTRFMVREDAHCAACQIRLRSRDHIIH